MLPGSRLLLTRIRTCKWFSSSFRQHSFPEKPPIATSMISDIHGFDLTEDIEGAATKTLENIVYSFTVFDFSEYYSRAKRVRCFRM